MSTSERPLGSIGSSPTVMPSDVTSVPGYTASSHARRPSRQDREPPMSRTTSRTRRPMQQSFLALCAEMGSSVAQLEEEGVHSAVPPLSRLRTRRDEPGAQTGIDMAYRKPRLQNRQDMLQSLPALSHRTVLRQRRKNMSLDDTMSTSQILSPPSASPRKSAMPPTTPMHALAEVSSMASSTSDVHSEEQEEQLATSQEIEVEEDAVEALPDVLARIFNLERREDVFKVYSCTTMRSTQSTMIPGHLYVLQRFVCFYAYLPHRAQVVTRSGYVQKRGRQNPRFNKYWFILRGNSLSYYTDKSQPYFPRNTIDLASATSARIISSSTREVVPEFSVITDKETYSFRTETMDDAKAWVQQIENTIFRTRNDSDSIKYLIPIERISGIEEEQILVSTTTIQINVKNKDAAIDEYIFLFYGGEHDLKEQVSILQSSSTASSQHPDLIPIREPVYRSAEIGVPPNQVRPLSQHGESSSIQSSGVIRPGLTTHDSSTSLYQKATGIAGFVKSQSKRVGNLLANESYTYYDKAYGMWRGEKTRYDDSEDIDSSHEHPPNDQVMREHNERFRVHFSLPRSERLQATYYCYLSRTVPRYGKMYMGITRICFRSLLPPFRTKMILPYRVIESVVPKQSHLSSTYGLVLSIRGQEELFFEFRERDSRDDCYSCLSNSIEMMRNLEQSSFVNPSERARVDAAKAEHDLLVKIRRNSRDNVELTLPDMEDADTTETPLIYDDYEGSSSTSATHHPGPLRITCLTIGSRGDVQPFIALAKGLIAEGHTVTIATHAEFEDWIRSHGIDFAPVAGDPAQLMRLCVEHDMFTAGFMREAWSSFRGMVSDILTSAWESCRDCDLLIEAPNAMAGIHIAEAMHIPIFRAFTMPWTKTRAHPHAFMVPKIKRGGLYNYGSHALFQHAYWQGTSGLVNAWRQEKLRLGPTTFGQMQQERIPFLYNFSHHVVSTPLDWDPWIKITGYWFLDEGGSTYTPPVALTDFIAKARLDDKKLVYIGFGSIVIDDAPAFTQKIVEAVVKADVRCVLSKGWSNRLDTKSTEDAPPLPDAIFAIDKAPHDWLFAQMDAAVHHGGAGTTGASVRAGIPTIVKPFFGDQWFFGQRVEDLAIGITIHNIDVDNLAAALVEVTTSRRILSRAKELGERVRSENGVQTAIHTIYRNLDYARSLTKARTSTSEEPVEELEDGWTLIDDDHEPYELEGQESPEIEGPAFEPSFAPSMAGGNLTESEGEEDAS